MRLRRLTARARLDAGFGLIELLIAMGVMSIGIMAVFGMFEAGIVQIRRASAVTTASALADTEMEGFRAIRYDSIGLADAAVVATDSTYKADTAYDSASANRVNLPVCGTAPCTSSVPSQNKVGADNRQYRVDIYVTWQTVTNGRNVKRVTVVVRDGGTPTKVYARSASSFDQSTGI